MYPEPLATYRLQFREGFGFKEAAEAASYLQSLGISHLYASPYLQSVSQGYDIVDPSRVDEKLGGAAGHALFCESLKALGLSQMIDIVPNHMAIPGKENPWWWDVLKNGPSSRYARYFDVDWDSAEERFPHKVLLPVLGDQYGCILEKGELTLSHRSGVFTLHYQEHTFPIDSSSLVELLGRAAAASRSDLLAFLADSHARLPLPTAMSAKSAHIRYRDKSVLVNLLARLCRENEGVKDAIEAEVKRLNHDSDALDALLDKQNYRLAYWKSASRDLGYRRFFDIKDLAGLRVEDDEVFEAIHALAFSWVREGVVQALRIDHPDGLREPAAYFASLRAACPKTWIVAEKILGHHETVPWPIEGTTGYDFLNLINGLFIDQSGESALTQIYENFIGEKAHYPTIVHISKLLVIKELMGSELNRLTSLFVDICERHRRYRDYSWHDLQAALCEAAVNFPVYRSYVSTLGMRPEDEKYIAEAIPEDQDLSKFLKELLLMRIPGKLEEEFALRFQQLTVPVMAKGVEDTAFYRYNRFVALNEVGGNPGRFGTSLNEFHEACAVAKPLSMLATTTHDTKRSEDVRARLALLAEIPDLWEKTVKRFNKNSGLDPNTAYFLYQTLVGAWPIEENRLLAYMEKAVREAKVHTSWTEPNKLYESNLKDCIKALLNDAAFSEDLENFVSGLINPGRINSLSGTLIKLTAPGIPDIYQGTEIWDLSLVDPDNRRPVDFDLRRNLLASMPSSVDEIMHGMDAGLPKLWVIQETLRLRRERPELFMGAYQPLMAKGQKSAHVGAFMRAEKLITVVPRFPLKLAGDFGDTHLELPKRGWKNIFTGETFDGGVVLVGELLAKFPVALLLDEEIRA